MGQWSLAIEQHHENFDGFGYPFGLSGEQLSLGARIVAVADAFEVMTAARSYKKALSAVVAREELTRCAGSQFDPVVVRAFLNVSLGRLRWTIGPVSWLADLPVLSRLSLAGHAAVAGAQTALGVAAVTVGGAIAAHASVPPAATHVATVAGPVTPAKKVPPTTSQARQLTRRPGPLPPHRPPRRARREHSRSGLGARPRHRRRKPPEWRPPSR